MELAWYLLTVDRGESGVYVQWLLLTLKKNLNWAVCHRWVGLQSMLNRTGQSHKDNYYMFSVTCRSRVSRLVLCQLDTS